MLFQCSLSMMSLGILSKMTLKRNIKNGATLSVLLGLIFNVLMPNTTLNQSDRKDKFIKITDVVKSILQTKTFGHTQCLRLLLEKRTFIFFPEGEVEVCETFEVHVVVDRL